MIDLSGAFLPVTTPFDSLSGEVEMVAFRENLRGWFTHPIRGVLIAGSTGEAVFLDERERSELVAAARDSAPEHGLVIAGTGAESTRATLRLTREAAFAGADAVLVSPPAFYRGAMTPEALARHYLTVADASPVPVLIYQVPLRLSTLDLSTGLVAELSRHPNIVGIKDSRGKLELVGALVEQCAEGFQVLVGSGAILYGALETGAVGGIVAVGLLAPAEAAGIVKAFREGRSEEAGRLQERIAPVHTGIVAGMGVPGIKAALDLMSMHGGAPRPPLLPAPEKLRQEAARILREAGLLAGARA